MVLMVYLLMLGYPVTVNAIVGPPDEYTRVQVDCPSGLAIGTKKVGPWGTGGFAEHSRTGVRPKTVVCLFSREGLIRILLIALAAVVSITAVVFIVKRQKKKNTK
jgi:hypothetical protein